MDQNLINQLFQVCLIPMLGALTTFVVIWIKAKSAELQKKTDSDILNKYVQMATDTITNCVIATNKTYVNSLKEQGKFDEAAQKEAFQKTYQAVLLILSDDAKEYLNNAFGDLNKYLQEKIESTVNNYRTPSDELKQ